MRGEPNWIEAAVENHGAKIFEPLLFKEGRDIRVLGTRLINESKGTLGSEALSLGDAAGEVWVNLHVGIDVVEHEALGVLHVDGALPCHTPVGDILLGEAFCPLE